MAPDPSPGTLSFRARNVIRDHLAGTPWTREAIADLRTIDLLAVPFCGPTTVEEIAAWMRSHGLEIDRPPADAALVEAAHAAIRAAGLPKLSALQRDRLMREIVKVAQSADRGEKRTNEVPQRAPTGTLSLKDQ